MLTFEEYISLDNDLQTQVLSLDGVYLELIRSCRNLNVELYSLYNFYVEVFFDRVTEEPLYLKAFKNTRHLNPYLELIDIADVFGIREEGL
ncbi:MAG TPA: hypothetical protein VFS22_05695 [Flavisolibacter sp.]|nr:hypothetical protein [Flavisolibacter sp.]